MAKKIDIKEVTDKSTKNKKYEFWKKQIDNSIETHKVWLKEAENYYRIYNNDNYESNSFKFDFLGENSVDNSLNIFYSNVEVRRPLIYSKLPNVDIRRRYRSSNRVSRITATVLERACNFFLENYRGNKSFNKAVLDKEVTGRGVVRLVLEEGVNNLDLEDGQTVQEVDDSLRKISIKFVPYDRLLIEPAKDWDDVSWIAFAHQMSKAEIAEKFGNSKANKLEYTESSLNSPLREDNKEEETLKVLNLRTTVFEIWDKDSRKIIFYSPLLDDMLLDEVDDNYNLKDFFPIPRPLGIFSNNKGLIPIPLFRQYRTKFVELQENEERIRNLVKQAKVCYAVSTMLEKDEVNSILNENDGVASPIKTIDAKGDLNKQIYAKDIVPIVNAISVLLNQKLQLQNDIKEITGISDIIRGVTEASETATAQKIKGDFAVSRMQIDQQEVQYFIRDVLRIMVELIAEHYSIEELIEISGLNIIDVKAQARQVAIQADQQDLPEEQAQQLIQETIQSIQVQLKTTFSATVEEAQQINFLMKNDKFRDFNIDIETDSTIKVDNDIEKAQRIELLNALSGTLNQLIPLQQAGVLTDDAVKEMIGFVIRPFKVGRNLEEALLEKQDTTERDKQQQALQQAQLQIQFEKEVARPARQDDLKQQELEDKKEIERAKIESEEYRADQKSETDIAIAEMNAKSRNNKKED